MRIRFIEPAPTGHHVYDRVLLPRLGTPARAAWRDQPRTRDHLALLATLEDTVSAATASATGS